MLPGTEIVFIDDDIEAIKMKTPTGLVHVRNLHRLADYIFQLMKYKGDDCLLAGVYPVANPLWMNLRVGVSNAYIAGCFYCLINDERVPEPIDDELEDYGRQLRLQAQGLPTLRINWIGVQTKYFKNPGGMQTLRTPERRKNAVTEMVAMYPTLVARKIRKDGTPDLRFLQKPIYWGDVLAVPSDLVCQHIPEADPTSPDAPHDPSDSPPSPMHHSHPTPPDHPLPDAT